MIESNFLIPTPLCHPQDSMLLEAKDNISFLFKTVQE